jgi:HAMP domain-containing protein
VKRSAPREARIEHYGKRFVPRITAAPIGTVIHFPNLDGIDHNAFSLSDAKPFDLGLYRGGEARSVSFDRPGIIHTQRGDVIAVGVPVRSASGAMLGAFPLTRSRATEGAAFRAIRRVVVYAGLIAIAVALPLAWLMGRGMSRPVEQLARAATTIRDGGLDVALPESGAQEVRALSRAFSSLVVELRQKQELERMLASATRPDQQRGPEPMQRVSSDLEEEP